MDYELISKQILAITDGVEDEVANLANISALLNENLEDINWVGFYMVKGNTLVLGPFQGRVACTLIPYNKGVCGTCFANDETILVEDVHSFKGHIACDSRSNSEIVLPIHKNNSIYAVLDIDSTSLSRFSLSDKEGLEKVKSAIEKVLNK